MTKGNEMNHIMYTIAMLVITVIALGAVIVSFNKLCESTHLDPDTLPNKLTLEKFKTEGDLERYQKADRQDLILVLDKALRSFRDKFQSERVRTGYAKTYRAPNAKAVTYL
jgi:hypothetical protein